jgi:hypothetical protein
MHLLDHSWLLATPATSQRISLPVASGASFPILVGDTAKDPNGVGFSLIRRVTETMTATSTPHAMAPAVDFLCKGLVLPDSSYLCRNGHIMMSIVAIFLQINDQ